MKRDMDLIREILLVVSDNSDCDGVSPNYYESAEAFRIHDHTTEEVAYHVLPLIQGGLLNGKVEESILIPSIKGLTWSGQEFIDNIKDKTIWERTKKRVADLPSVALSVMAQVALSEVKRQLGLP